MSILDFFLVLLALAGVGLRCYLLYAVRRPAAAEVKPAPPRPAMRPVLRLVPRSPRGFGQPARAA